MKPAVRLTHILQVLREKDKFQSFTTCQIGTFKKEGSISTHKIRSAYFKNDWNLIDVSLESELVGNQVNHICKIIFLNREIAKYYATLSLYLTKGISRLKVYRYFTESYYYGLTIEIQVTPTDFFWIIFYPILPEMLSAIEASIGEPLPATTETGEEEEIPYKTFIQK
jgi:hypothetical protein